MNRLDRKLVNEAQDLCWMFLHKMRAQTEIATSGPTHEGKMYECKGVFPQLSNVKPEILISKAEKMRFFDFLPEEQAAVMAWKDAIRAYPKAIRGKGSAILLLYRGLHNKENPDTKRRYTHADCAKEVKLNEVEYHTQLELLMRLLLIHYKKRKTQYVGISGKNIARCGN